MRTCELCNPANQGRRHKHLLSYQSAEILRDHALNDGGVKEHNLSALLDWWRTTRDFYANMRDEQNNPLTPDEAWSQSQRHASTQHYTVPNETIAHDIRHAYWGEHDPFQTEAEIAGHALTAIRQSLAHMGALPIREPEHSPAEIAAYLREQREETDG